jgi:hypothetical protein
MPLSADKLMLLANIVCLPGKTKTSENIAALFVKALPEFVTPRIVKSDGGLEVTGAPFKEMPARHDIKHTSSDFPTCQQAKLCRVGKLCHNISYVTSAEGQRDSTQRLASFAVSLRELLKAYKTHAPTLQDLLPSS